MPFQMQDIPAFSQDILEQWPLDACKMQNKSSHPQGKNKNGQINVKNNKLQKHKNKLWSIISGLDFSHYRFSLWWK